MNSTIQNTFTDYELSCNYIEFIIRCYPDMIIDKVSKLDSRIYST